ncbi:MAG: NHL repeat-containing protein [candidate division Zixibacteria bacterium]|nr:NHL repeat-containing protein [candidate division Zixibacteria bacterium]
MRFSVLIPVLLLLVSCAGNTTETFQRKSQSTIPIPVSIELKSEISGKVLTYRLESPSGLDIDPQGSIYVTETGHHRLIKFDRDGQAEREFGGYGAGISQFNNPRDITIDERLSIYVLDAGNSRIMHLDMNLNFIEEILPAEAADEIITSLSNYSGLHLSNIGELTVSDYDNSRLIQMDNFFEFSRYVGDFSYGRGALLNPGSIASDGSGRMFVADEGNSRIAVFDEFGNFKKSIGADKLAQPVAISVADNGLIWTADKETDSLYVFDWSDNLLAVFGNPDNRDEDFSQIGAVLAARNNLLYITDTGNDRILVYRVVYEQSEY